MQPDDLVGCEIVAGYRLDEALTPGLRSARFRGTAIAGAHVGQPVLITTATGPEAASPSFIDSIRFEGATGLVPLLDADIYDKVRPGLVAMVELEPGGTSLSSRTLPVEEARGRRLGLRLCDIARSAHESGFVVGGIRPELVYADAAFENVTVAPRAFSFYARGLPRSTWVNPPFDTCFEPPELRWNKAVATTDAYMIAAVVHYVVSGIAPFPGRDWVTQRDAGMEPAMLPYGGSPQIGETLSAMLSPAAEERPSLDTLAKVLAVG